MASNQNRENKRYRNVCISLNSAEYEELLGKALQAGVKPSVVARRMLLEHIRFFAQ